MSAIEIGQDSWHYRVYNWWNERNHFEEKKSYWFKENLCHYMRVVLIWAPLGWFFTEKVVGEFRPWAIVAVIFALLSLLVAIVTWPLATLALVGIVLVAIVVVLAFFAFLSLLEDSKIARVVVLIVTLPIWILPALLVISAMALSERFSPYYLSRHRYVVHLWFVTVLAIILGIYLLFGPETLAAIFILLAVLFAIAVTSLVIIVVIFVVIPEIVKAIARFVRNRRRVNQIPLSDSKPKDGVSTGKLFKSFAKTKVGSRICPFIVLPHQWDPSDGNEMDQEE